MGLLFGLALTACAPSWTWDRADPGTCAGGDPPRICFAPEVDEGQVLDVGGARIVPGECATGEKGRVGLVLERADGSRDEARVQAREGQTWQVGVADGKLSIERSGCSSGEVTPSLASG